MSRQSYAQSLFKLGLSPGDPIVQVGLAWAAGERVPAKDIRIAIRSAEHHRAGKDKMLRQRMASVINRLRKYLEFAEAEEARKGPKVYGERSLTTQPRTNPRRRSRRNPKGFRIKVSEEELERLIDIYEQFVELYVDDEDPAGAEAFARDHGFSSGVQLVDSISKKAEPWGIKLDFQALYRDRPSNNPRRARSRRNPRGEFYVHDQYLGGFLDFGSVKSAARFAKNRFGCEPAGDCVYVERDEALIPIGSLRSRKNPYTSQRPTGWAKMTRKERKAWNRKHWTSSPSGVSKKRVRRVRPLNEIMNDDLRDMKAQIRGNPRVAFRTCTGKRVAFKAKSRRKGKTPKHLKPYLFKKGHRGRKRCR